MSDKNLLADPRMTGVPIVAAVDAHKVTQQLDIYDTIVVAESHQFDELWNDRGWDLIGGLAFPDEVKGVFGVRRFAK